MQERNRREELADNLSDVWLQATRGRKAPESAKPDEQGRLVGEIHREMLKRVDALPQDDRDSGVRAGLQIFTALVRNGGAPVSPAEAAQWLVDGAVVATGLTRPACAAHPAVDPWNSGVIRLVGDFVDEHAIADLPLDPKAGAAVGEWSGTLFSEVFNGVAASQTGADRESLYHLALKCADAQPVRGGYVGLPSLGAKDVATWILAMYQSAVDAFRS